MDFVRSPAFALATGNRVDASKMILSGSSAGGWLCLLAGTGIGYAACGLEAPAPVSGIAALYPISDLADPFWTTKQRPVSYMPRVVPDDEVAPFIDPAAEKVAFTTLDSKRAVFYHYMVQEYVYSTLSRRLWFLTVGQRHTGVTPVGRYGYPRLCVCRRARPQDGQIHRATDICDPRRHRRQGSVQTGARCCRGAEGLEGRCRVRGIARSESSFRQGSKVRDGKYVHVHS